MVVVLDLMQLPHLAHDMVVSVIQLLGLNEMALCSVHSNVAVKIVLYFKTKSFGENFISKLNLKES